MPGTPTPAKLAYTVDELAAATSIGRSTIYNEMKAGRLHPTKVGNRTVFTAAEANRWLAAGQRAA